MANCDVDWSHKNSGRFIQAQEKQGPITIHGVSQGSGIKTPDICQCPAKISGNIHLGNISLYIIKY